MIHCIPQGSDMENREIQMSVHLEQRLDRLEHKIDSLADAVVIMARIEERMVTLFSRMDGYDKTQSHLTERVASLTDRIVDLEKRSLVLNVIERLFYIVATAAVAYAFWMFQQ